MFYFQPVLLVLVLIALLQFRLALLQHRKGKRYAWNLLPAIILAAGLFLWSWPPVATISMRILEGSKSVPVQSGGDAEVIVVLASGVLPKSSFENELMLDNPSSLRCHHAVWLHRNWRPLPVLCSGGASVSYKVPVAEVMKGVLEREGVPAEMIWLEQQSQSTFENAVYTARLLKSKGIRKIALVTEAYHMRRAAACFRKQGLEVLPAPCGYRHINFSYQWTRFLPETRAMEWNESALHEWLGLAWYALSGKI